jgi:hypothetical protein
VSPFKAFLRPHKKKCFLNERVQFWKKVYIEQKVYLEI